jgi:5S rRNA maturation endonuclease (ribonuclease M5)
MRKRVLCPRHEEKTPSCVIYDTHAYCFGRCMTKIPLEEVGLSPTDYETQNQPEPENIEATMRYIDTLDKVDIRGFSLPTDGEGYYLVWPDRSYYKYRRFEGEPKYIGPRGHKPPLLVAHDGVYSYNCAIVVEGEFNAMSVQSAIREQIVFSPGSASNFYGRGAEALLTHLTAYRKIFIIADQDAAGAKAAIELKSSLLARGHPYVYISLWPKDANDIMVQDGKEALQNKISEVLDLQRRVRDG